MAENEWLSKDFYKVLGVSKDATDAEITKAYRKELDELAAKKDAYAFSTDALTALSEASPRPLGIGAFRYRISR